MRIRFLKTIEVIVSSLIVPHPTQALLLLRCKYGSGHEASSPKLFNIHGWEFRIAQYLCISHRIKPEAYSSGQTGPLTVERHLRNFGYLQIASQYSPTIHWEESFCN